MAVEFIRPDDSSSVADAVIDAGFLVPESAIQHESKRTAKQNTKIEKDDEFGRFAMTVLQIFRAEECSTINIGATANPRPVAMQKVQLAISVSVRLCTLDVEKDL